MGHSKDTGASRRLFLAFVKWEPPASSSAAAGTVAMASSAAAERFVYALVAHRGVVLAEGANKLLQGDFARIASVFLIFLRLPRKTSFDVICAYPSCEP